MEPLTILSYGSTFFLISLIIYIVFSTKLNKSTILFSATLIFLLGWALTLYGFYFVSDMSTVIFWGRVNFTAAVLFAPSLFLFANNFPQKRKTSLIEILIIIETALLSVFSQFTQFVVVTEKIQGTDRITEYGYGYTVFLLHFVGYLLWALIVIWKKGRTLKDKYKKQNVILFWSILIALLFGITTNIVIPILYTETKLISLDTYTYLQNLGVLSSLIFGIPITYAILKYQFLDIRILLGKLLTKIILSVSVITTFYTTTFIYEFFFGTVFKVQPFIIGLFVAMLFVTYFENLITFVNEQIGKYIINPFYNNSTAIKKFNNELAEQLKPSSIIGITLDTIKKTIAPITCVIKFEQDDDSAIFDGGKKKNITSLVSKIEKLLHTKPDGIISLEDIELEKETGKSIEGTKVEIEKLLISGDFKVCVPIHNATNYLGVILLGDRYGQIPYSSIDKSFLESIGESLGWALTRAQLYLQLEIFNKDLQKKVDEATRSIQRKNFQLQNTYEELKTLDDAKSEFISIASHQLRTPISIIRGYLSMMNTGDFGDLSMSQAEAIAKTLSNVQQLNDIVEDILNASRVERGKLAVNPEKEDLIELCKSVVQQLKSKAEIKNLTLSFKTAVKSFIVNMDRNKIYEVIMNLVDNAINYTPRGSIKVTCDTDGKDTIIISVKDSGIGIPKSFQSKIFERFSRSENAKSIRPDGTGIGLYVAKSFVDAHKGKLWFESKENEGTTFFVRLNANPNFDFEIPSSKRRVNK